MDVRGSSPRRERIGKTMIAICEGHMMEQTSSVSLSLAECLYRAAEESSDRGIVYVRIDNSEIFQTYGALLREAQTIRGGLEAFGLRPGNLVLFQLHRHDDFIRAFWACVLGGFIALPVASPRPHAVADKLDRIWERFGHPVVLTASASMESVQRCFHPHQTDLRIADIDVLP